MEMTAIGHAGYAPVGEDIVCAGVSALLYAFLTYLRDTACTRVDRQVAVEEGDGYLWVRCRGLTACDASALAVIETGLRLIARSYPTHVSITHSEEKEENNHGKSTIFGR